MRFITLTCFTLDGVFDGKRVLSQASVHVMMSPSVVPFRSLPLWCLEGSHAALAGVVTPSTAGHGCL